MPVKLGGLIKWCEDLADIDLIRLINALTEMLADRGEDYHELLAYDWGLVDGKYKREKDL